jgi:hypothetical protein
LPAPAKPAPATRRFGCAGEHTQSRQLYEHYNDPMGPLTKGVSAGGRSYAVYAWIGSRASPRAALDAVIASLSFTT